MTGDVAPAGSSADLLTGGVSAVSGLSGRAARLVARVLERGRVRVAFADLLADWHAVAPELLGRVDRVELLVAAVTEAAGAGVFVLPAAGSWDRSFSPPVPKFVSVPTARRPQRERVWARVAWRPELVWVADLVAVSDEQLVALRAVNAWLGSPARAAARPVPHRLRSAELFGDEKLLDRLSVSALFGPGRLSFELLGCRRFATPLPAVRVGAGAAVLVVENVDPFWAAAGVLSSASAAGVVHEFGWVVWGHGNEFSSGVAALTDQFGAGVPVWYWGDLDPAGVAIAARVSTTDPRVRPHRGLWLALAGLTAAGSAVWPEPMPAGFDEVVWAAAASVRAVGGRVAQERLPVDALERALLA